MWQRGSKWESRCSFHGLWITRVTEKSKLASAKVTHIIKHCVPLSGQIISVMERMRKAQLTSSFLHSHSHLFWKRIRHLVLCHQLQCEAHESCLGSSRPALFHPLLISHCSGLMQNAITFSIGTSLSQEVKGKHISHCVPAALILLMAKHHGDKWSLFIQEALSEGEIYVTSLQQESPLYMVH